MLKSRSSNEFQSAFMRDFIANDLGVQRNDSKKSFFSKFQIAGAQSMGV